MQVVRSGETSQVRTTPVVQVPSTRTSTGAGCSGHAGALNRLGGTIGRSLAGPIPPAQEDIRLNVAQSSSSSDQKASCSLPYRPTSVSQSVS